MENFEEMLDDFIDENSINEKLESDDIITDNKSVNKNNKNNSNFERTIPISQFVRDYLGTEHNCKNLKHKGLKSFKNPYIIGVSNDFAIKNPDCIIRNEIIVVIDDYGKPGTYINPNILKQIKSMEEYKLALSILEQIKLYDLKSINELYTKYNEIAQKIEDLEKIYIDSCDLLMCLEKKYILKEIRRYVKQAKKINFKFITKQKQLQTNIDFRYNILNNIEKSENEIDNYDELYEGVNNKVNRQKTNNKIDFLRRKGK